MKNIHSEFIQEKLMDEKHAKLLAKLLQLRTKADYDGSYTAKKEDVEIIFIGAIELISFAERFSNESFVQ